ncbi:MAG: FHA domain-containing protein [Acidobacteria bacterium]|nr:FHA domain-containing protein [Acidobacteriota bacterium]
MSTPQQSTFIITREGRAEEAKTLLSDGLRIGRLPDSDVWLNHPSVSRLHAGINEIEGYFYLINLSGSSVTALNGRPIPFNEAEALAARDEILIGPFVLCVEDIDTASETLRIRIGRQLALNAGEREARHETAGRGRQSDIESPTVNPFGAVNALQVFWSKRTREKAGRPSPLHPRTLPRIGKARFNWRPTRDLVRPWPFGIVIWAFLIFGVLSALAAFNYKNLFAPGKTSDPHTRTAFTLTPPIATRPNNNSCTSCHALGASMASRREKMNENCAACHQTSAFSPTVIRAHREAGLGCADCHTEHKGANFRPMHAALESCAKCHADENKNLYNGRSVHTPHGGTYGYPVVNGAWVWKGLDEEELAAKPEIVAFLKEIRITPDRTERWRNWQFHAVHVDRVRVVPGIEGITDAAGVNKVLSCSSCHKTGYMGTDVDRASPRATCALCHNARVFNEPARFAGEADKPSCTSCHVQHVKDAHWAPSLLNLQAESPVAQ